MPETIYYYYHNPDKNPHIKIHKSTCGHCNFGSGKHPNAEKGLNSVWTGPFYNLEWVTTYITNNIRINYPIEYCSHCMND